MKCLVTGGAGFIGTNLVERLLHDRHEVAVVDNFSTGSKANVQDGALYYEVDIRNMAELQGAFDEFKPDVVFHMAALARIQPSIKNPRDSHDVNMTGTLNVLLASRDASVKRVVFSSSSSIYGEVEEAMLPADEGDPGRPMNPYAVQKLQAEYYCALFSNLYGLETVALRYFNVYGEHQILEGAYAALVGIFFDQKRRGKPFTIVGDGEQRRDFTYVGDVVDANVRAAFTEGVSGNVYNIGTGKNHSVVEIANMIDPGHPKEFMEARAGECRATLACNIKAHQELGWEPTVEIADWVAKNK